MKKHFAVAKGRISGTYADSFHLISEDGKIGYNLDRDPSPAQISDIIDDIRRHRETLLNELLSLSLAEKALTK